MSRYIRNVIHVPGQALIHICPKVATASQSRALVHTGYHHISPTAVCADTAYRFMIVRHPLDRLVSAWAFFCNSSAPMPDELQELGYWKYMPFDIFLDVVEKRHGEENHTRAQIWYAGPHHADIDPWPFERLNDAWEHLRANHVPKAAPLDHLHGSEHDDWKQYYLPYRRTSIERLFDCDMALYERACERH